jgi:hypothetical protein
VLALAPPEPRPLAVASTLDELLTGAWEGLLAGRSVSCPVCGSEMGSEDAARERRLRGADVGAVGRCRDCGCTLS